MKTRSLILVILIALILLLTARPQLGCGPFAPEAIFTYSVHPDLPLEKFAAGELGVLQPNYARSYLAVAYRYLSGGSFDRAEQKALVSLWDERLGLNDDKVAKQDVEPSWLDVRRTVPGIRPDPKIEADRVVDPKEPYQRYLNCPDNAFDTAARTLRDLIKTYGAGSAEVKQWVEAQDQVFANCGGGQSIPAELGAGAAAPLRAHREYQVAAANFYSASFDTAEQMFRGIAADSASPWRTIAPYLTARCLIRKAALTSKEEWDAKLLAQAESQLRSIIADTSRGEIHSQARSLLRLVLLRSKPDQAARDLTRAVLKKSSGQTLKQDLWDYTWALDQLVKGKDEPPRKFVDLSPAGRDDDLTDWVLVFQITDRAAEDYAVQKWIKTKSVPWLVAALSKISGGNPQMPALLEAASNVKQGSPAFVTVAFNSLRLMIESGQQDEARKRLDALLSAPAPSISASSLNLFRSLRMQVAVNLDDLLRFAQRTPATISYNEDGRELPFDPSGDARLAPLAKRTSLDSESAAVINQKLPLAELKLATTSKALPAHLRGRVALACWVRAVLLDQEQTAAEITPIVQTLVPSLKEQMNAYVTTESGEFKKMVALYIVSKNPGMQPLVDPGIGRLEEVTVLSDYRDNWWCAVGSGAIRNPIVSSPAFLGAGERAAADRELKQLASLGPAPNYLCVQAVRWASIKPDDPRVPEALHLAVRATRFGCTDAETGKFSKQAFDVLHRKYPRSEWAEKTKYWFK
jgi:hypothetical protein